MITVSREIYDAFKYFEDVLVIEIGVNDENKLAVLTNWSLLSQTNQVNHDVLRTYFLENPNMYIDAVITGYVAELTPDETIKTVWDEYTLLANTDIPDPFAEGVLHGILTALNNYTIIVNGIND